MPSDLLQCQSMFKSVTNVDSNFLLWNVSLLDIQLLIYYLPVESEYCKPQSIVNGLVKPRARIQEKYGGGERRWKGREGKHYDNEAEKEED